MCVLGSLGSRQDVSRVFILVPHSDEDRTLTWEYLLLITALGKTNFFLFFFWLTYILVNLKSQNHYNQLNATQRHMLYHNVNKHSFLPNMAPLKALHSSLTPLSGLPALELPLGTKGSTGTEPFHRFTLDYEGQK